MQNISSTNSLCTNSVLISNDSICVLFAKLTLFLLFFLCVLFVFFFCVSCVQSATKCCLIVFAYESTHCMCWFIVVVWQSKRVLSNLKEQVWTFVFFAFVLLSLLFKYAFKCWNALLYTSMICQIIFCFIAHFLCHIMIKFLCHFHCAFLSIDIKYSSFFLYTHTRTDCISLFNIHFVIFSFCQIFFRLLIRFF
jgi:hypothetical protein